jgi:hypothetical protein
MGLRAARAEVLHASGALRLAMRARTLMPPRSVAVLTYHHVCEPGAGYRFDPDVADVTPAQFRRQLAILTRHFTIIDLPTLARPRRRAAAAEPVPDHLRRRLPLQPDRGAAGAAAVGATATFFIATGFTTHRRLYWWDRIAYLVHHAPRRGSPDLPEPRDAAARRSRRRPRPRWSSWSRTPAISIWPGSSTSWPPPAGCRGTPRASARWPTS